jgi:predicted nucleotidyltransferase
MRTLEEASTVTAEARDILAAVKNIVHEKCPAATILLYGSVSRGTQTAESDYDFLILTPHALSRSEKREIERGIYALELERETVLCTIYCSKEQWDSPLWRGSPLFEEVQRDGVTL